MAKKLRDSRLQRKSTRNVEEMWEMLDLPKEQIVFSDTETDENKVLE